MNHDHSLDQLFADAGKFSPHGEPSHFGFETRLRAALRAAGRDLSLSEWIARVSWRFSVTAVPLLVTLAFAVSWQSQSILPEGMGDILIHWMEFLPLAL